MKLQTVLVRHAAVTSDAVERVYGVNFSGGQSAGEKIWLTSGVIQDEELVVEGCFLALELPDSG